MIPRYCKGSILTRALPPAPTATEMAYLGSGHVLAAPLMALSELAPAPLSAPLTTTHRVISYTYDSLYRLITATYSSGESYRYTYPSTSLRTGDAVVNLLQHGGQIRRSGWDDVFLTADVLMVWEVTQCGVVCRRSGRSRQ
jgi:hypothetical protein